MILGLMEGRAQALEQDGDREVVYCVVPRELAEKLHEPLRRHFRDDPGVEVIVERRGEDAERRRAADRRAKRKGEAGEAPGGRERREVSRASGRRIAERRAPQIAVDPPPLPRRAQRHRDSLSFVRRMEPAGLRAEDADTERLIVRAQAGETELFGLVYQRYFERVYSYMKVAFREPSDAEDAAQQAFLNAFEALPRYVSGPRPFRSWLFAIARNHAIDLLRASKELLSLDALDGDDEPREEPIEGLPSLDWLSDPDLHIFIDRLPLAQQQVVILRYGFGFTNAETAAILGKQPGTVRKQHSRALSFLRDRLIAIGRAPADHRPDDASEALLRRSTVLRRRRYSLLPPR